MRKGQITFSGGGSCSHYYAYHKMNDAKMEFGTGKIFSGTKYKFGGTVPVSYTHLTLPTKRIV